MSLFRLPSVLRTLNFSPQHRGHHILGGGLAHDAGHGHQGDVETSACNTRARSRRARVVDSTLI